MTPLAIGAACSAVALALGLAGGAWGAYALADARWSSKWSDHIAADADAALQAAAGRDKRADKLSDELERINADLAATEAENDRRAACIAAGTCGVRIVAAKCPSVPASSGSTAVGTVDTAPQLDPAARSTYDALRRGLANQYALLEKCRAYAQANSSTRQP